MEVLQALGKYEIRGTLGSGAMGVVYDGWDPQIARRVAIKAVRLPTHPDPETEEEIGRFRREAQAAGRLSHPNIVAVYDYGETGELAYIVMEFVDGPTLKSLLDKHERFTLPDIRRIMGHVLTALQFSHSRGVVHRDIKPANVMLTLTGEAKLADFGIARIESSSLTQAGTVLGTPAYMSPEQFMGQVVDARTDIYSAGVLLYQLLTGERPYDGSLTAIMHKVLNTEPPAPSQLAVTSPAALDAVVRQAMAKRPEDRFASATAFDAAIGVALAAPAPVQDAEATMVAAAPRPSPHATAAPRVRPGTEADRPAVRNKLVAITAGVVGVLVIAGGGWWVATRPVPQSVPVTSEALAPQAAGTRAPAAQPPDIQTAATAPAAVPSASSATGTSAAARNTVTPPATAPAATAVVAPPVAEPSAAPPTATAPTQTAVGPPPATPAQGTSSTPPAARPHSAPAASASVPVVPPPPPPTPTAAPPPPPTPTAAPPPPPIPAQNAALSPPQAPAHSAPVLPPPAPAVEQTASASLTPVRRQIEAALARADCALVNGAVQDSGAITVSGLAGSGADPVLRASVMELAGGRPLDWRVRGIDPAFCGALGALHAVAPAAGAPDVGLRLALAGGRTALRDGEHIIPRVVMPGFAGHVRVDYIAHDGSVAHLYPTQADPVQHFAAAPDRVLQPGATLELGAGGGKPVWEVGPPYGTDMIIAVASSTPLLREQPPNVEGEADAYLRRLRAAIDAARRAGARVTGTLLLVDTLPK